MAKDIIISELPVSRFLFANTAAAPLWFLIRLYVGWVWISAGWGKITSPAWTGAEAGSALSGFVQGALAKTAGAHPDVSGWYAEFLQAVVLPQAVAWAHLVAWGEVLVGAALIIGAFTGLVAFAGLFMNLNFMLAGALSVNPVLFSLSILLVLAWRVSGWWGADRWLLPRLGVPWEKNRSC
jgi:thiosulfate dehydrogenase [quinone] large subunit